ncbi:TolC family protein, partial [Longibacter sp.]|uniref:TolC family protein n=1 Tax=Longibacter sp. TaxID=2045415 RepID=UPI003EBBE65A
FLGGGGQGDWVAFNERARQDGDPSTEPITFNEFLRRQEEAQEEAGVSFADTGNPFGVDNEFLGSVQLTQTLYDKSAFAALRGAQQFQDVSRRGLDRQVQTVANDVYEAFYAALLAEEQVRVLQQRTDRTEETLQEVSARVRRGVAPKLQRMSTEVELSNLRTELIQAQNDAGLALDRLKVALGLSVDANIRLDGALETDSQDLFINTSQQEALSQAMQQRPDLKRARLAIDLREIERETIEAEYYPTLEAVATFSYSGRVPDNREQILTDPTDPFFYDTLQRGFFDDSYWNPTLSAGLQMSWNVFNGFQTTARMEQQTIEITQAELQRDQLQQSIELEVSSALRRLETARRRIQSQRQTVQNAETNYEFTERRLDEGVSSALELREASDQLDRSRLNYLQAVYDYLVARSDLETAVGVPLTPATEDYEMTAR